MSLRAAVQSELPHLRRYARTITGTQQTGDALVREALEALIAAPDEFDLQAQPRFELYRIFHRIWNSATLAPIEVLDRNGVISALATEVRQTLILTTVEGFSARDAAEILQTDVETVKANVERARASVEAQLHASVMIIEDESIIALHLRRIVEGLGHEVAGVARTRTEAVKLADEVQPELVLADISLADGSSGIDAVTDILAEQSVPVIFITAFPERLLTGERPEPTYLITKPFEQETVAATIWQALLVHRETVALQAEAA